MALPPVVFVTPAQIRRLFVQGGYEAKIKNRELSGKIVKNKPAPWTERFTPPEPKGTRSQIVDYFDKKGQKILSVHRYVRPGAAIGASGKMDPKALLHNSLASQWNSLHCTMTSRK
jgi:hypothetical protein